MEKLVDEEKMDGKKYPKTNGETKSWEKFPNLTLMVRLPLSRCYLLKLSTTPTFLLDKYIHYLPPYIHYIP